MTNKIETKVYVRYRGDKKWTETDCDSFEIVKGRYFKEVKCYPFSDEDKQYFGEVIDRCVPWISSVSVGPLLSTQHSDAKKDGGIAGGEYDPDLKLIYISYSNYYSRESLWHEIYHATARIAAYENTETLAKEFAYWVVHRELEWLPNNQKWLDIVNGKVAREHTYHVVIQSHEVDVTPPMLSRSWLCRIFKGPFGRQIKPIEAIYESDLTGERFDEYVYEKPMSNKLPSFL